MRAANSGLSSAEPFLENLEPRRMFSGGALAGGALAALHRGEPPGSAATVARPLAPAVRRATPFRRAHPNADWPAAPFAAQLRAGIYVNQWGVATVSSQSLIPFSAYSVWFDDGGPITVSTTGRVTTDVSFYDETGYPILANTRGRSSRSTTVTTEVSPDKLLNYIGVRPHVAGARGTFTLHVAGPPEGEWSDPGGSDISGTYDYDFYRYRLSHGGDWMVTVKPSSHLDVSINVYDAAGNPIGGTFTSAIDAAGPGRAETWTGVGLSKGTYYVRVDGTNNRRGTYGVSSRFL
jgi:hypothetical protein